jgi:hypothetical protein
MEIWRLENINERDCYFIILALLSTSTVVCLAFNAPLFPRVPGFVRQLEDMLTTYFTTFS